METPHMDECEHDACAMEAAYEATCWRIELEKMMALESQPAVSRPASPEPPPAPPPAPANCQEAFLLECWQSSQAMALNAQQTLAAGDMISFHEDRGGPVVAMSHQRARELGFLLKGGRLPSKNDPMTLSWPTGKPSDFTENLAYFNPVTGVWRVHANKRVVPISMRSQPAGYGYGAVEGCKCTEESSFPVALLLGHQEDCQKRYEGSALGDHLEEMKSVLHKLDICEFEELAAPSGWGSDEFYTPCLRHVKKTAAPEGGMAVFEPLGNVQPLPGVSHWDSVNSCIVYTSIDARIGERALDR